ncbi:choline/ethanolamine kinase-like [Dermatophagoides farinae]|uniref:choline/ethanolamine kinase-like n=1 Tax=Dermatophagoides farinae TaxID=6954 RepID=UPI003F5E306B
MLSFPRSICRKYISTWRDVDPNEIQVELMQAGLSNKLFILSVPNKEPSKAFLRLYGPLRQTLAKIIDEQTILEVLTEVKLTAKIYASFEEGRIEEFLNGQMLTIDEFYTEPIYKKLISKLHLLHNLQKVKPKLLTLKGNETAIISIIRDDIHSQNALIDNDKLHLVDYEFSGFNYRAYELATEVEQCQAVLSHRGCMGVRQQEDR